MATHITTLHQISFFVLLNNHIFGARTGGPITTSH